MKSAIPSIATAPRTPVCTITSTPAAPSAPSNPSWLTTHQHFVEYGRNAKEWTRKCILLLPEIQKQQIWKKKRFKDIYDYARKLAGMSHNQVNEALRILGKAENLPAIRRVIEERGINAVKPIISIATASTDQFWAEKSQIMGQHPLEAYVKGFRKLQSVNGLRAEASQSVNLQISPLAPSEDRSQSVDLQNTSMPLASLEPKATIIMQLDPSIADQLSKMKGSGNWNELMKKFLAMHEKELERNKPAIVEVITSRPATTRTPPVTTLSKATKPFHSRTIPAAIRKHVLAKTNSTCAFPSCHKPHKILHHTERFAMYHAHDPNHIVPLCEAHERLAHLGLIENEQKAPQNWQIRSAPDYNSPEYEIDHIVGQYRQKKS